MQRAGLCSLFLAAAFVVATFAGCSGGGGGGGGLPSGNLTVVARVVTPSGQPVPNVAIWISGHGPFFTDAQGEITAMGMPSPYDAVVVEGSTATAQVWPGLTRSDPVFTTEFLLPSTIPFEATIDGVVSGGAGFPEPPMHETRVQAIITNTFGSGSDIANTMTGAYDATLGWVGTPTAQATCVAMQALLDANGDPATFTGWGSLDLTITSGEVLSGQNIVMSPVANTTVTGTIIPAAGLTRVGVFRFLEVAPGAFWTLANSAQFVPAFSTTFPVVPGVDRWLGAFAFAGGFDEGTFTFRADLPDPATNLSIAVPATTSLLLPFEGAIGVNHQTVFEVTPRTDDRVFTVTFSPMSGSAPRIVLMTTASTFSIPDLSAFGIVIPPATDYTWDVIANGPLANLDEAATEGMFLSFFPVNGNGSGDLFFTSSSERNFTFGN